MQKQAAQNTRPPYLFYSPKCPNCSQLIELIKQYDFVAETIVPVNVHTTKNLPPELVKVPTILYNNQMLVGSDAFKWVSFQSSIKNGQKNNQQAKQQGNNSVNQQQNQPSKSEPVPIDFNMDSKNAIGYDVLPTTQSANMMPSYNKTSFSFFNENSKNNNEDGLTSADHAAASDLSQSQKQSDKGSTAQFEQLQKLREQGF